MLHCEFKWEIQSKDIITACVDRRKTKGGNHEKKTITVRGHFSHLNTGGIAPHGWLRQTITGASAHPGSGSSSRSSPVTGSDSSTAEGRRDN